MSFRRADGLLQGWQRFLDLQLSQEQSIVNLRPTLLRLNKPDEFRDDLFPTLQHGLE